jgi:hypothetical protein
MQLDGGLCILFVMPRVKLIVILVTYAHYLYSINCPTVICLPSILLFILWIDTISELWTPVQFPLHYYTIYFTCSTIILLPLDTLIPLFIANQWDWQPHRKLGAKFLVVLCAGSTLLLVQSKALDEAPYKLSGAVAKLAGITFWSLTFSYWFNKPQFLTKGKLATVLITPSLGVPNWSIIYINTAQQSEGPCVRQCDRYCAKRDWQSDWRIGRWRNLIFFLDSRDRDYRYKKLGH